MSVRQMSVCLLLVLVIAAAVPAFAAKRVLNGKIAFVSNRDGNSEIYVMNPDGSGQTRMTFHPGEDVDPAWSPDGSRIAFTRDRQIHVMNHDGSGVIQLTQRGSNEGPAWSPDGTRIAFHSTRDSDPSQNHEIYVMREDGSNQTRLTVREDSDYRPAWSPDGRSIVYSCRRVSDGGTVSTNLCIMNADGDNVENLTTGTGGPFDHSPSFSPDGKVIVVSRARIFGDRERVTLIDADGTSPNGLALGLPDPFLEENTRPVFSPDGKKIAFAAGEVDEISSIRIMLADGSGEVSITNNPAVRDRQPNWQRAVPADTTGVYVPSTGKWLLRTTNTAGEPDIIVGLGGQPGDLPVAGDWNGDGQTDIGIFRNGTFLRSLLKQIDISCAGCPLFVITDAIDPISFGQPGDLPVAGDWDGDGDDDIGVFRPDELGTFILRVPTEVQLCAGCPPHTIITTETVALGSAGHLPIAGDWDGDGKDGVGIYDPRTAIFVLSDDRAKPNFVFSFGEPGDRPLIGNWLGLGRDGVGVFQPPLPTMVLSSQVTAPPDIEFAFGVSEGLPVAGHWTAVP